MKLGKKIIAYLLTICMILLMVPGVEARADDGFIDVSTYSELKAKVTGSCNIRLKSDVVCSEGISIENTDATQNKIVVVLDLNGHTLSRNLQSAGSAGYVIAVDGDLTIKDSASSGKITGGNNTGNGGGVYVSPKGSLTLNSGSITGNHASKGGGVYNLGVFNMQGGSITENTAANGGGVYQASASDGQNVSTGTTNIVAGEISSNKVTANGGGIYQQAGAFNLDSTTISDNEASTNGGGIYYATGAGVYKNVNINKNKAGNGGGIYFDDISNFSLTAGATITENTATTNGGGIYILSGNAVAIGGKIIIKDNTKDGNANNAYFKNGTTMGIFLLSSASPLLNGSNICITFDDNKKSFTDETASDSLVQYFHSDIPDKHFLCTNSALYCHALTATAKVAATEDKDGCMPYWYCSTCQKYYSDAYGESLIGDRSYFLNTWQKKYVPEGGLIPKGNVEIHTHEYVLVPEQSATCTETGKSAYFTCKGCDKIFDTEKKEITDEGSLVIPAKGHSYKKVDAVAATCTEAGKKEHYICTVCNKFFDTSYQEVKENSLTIGAKGHSYGEWTSKQDGTGCTKTCSVCHDTQEQDHTMGNTWEQSSDKSYCSKTCSSCGYIQKNMHDGASCSYCKWAKPHEHNFENVAAKAAGCTADGNIAYKECIECHQKYDSNGDELTDDKIILPATGHSYVATVTAPTCLEKGYTTHTCNACGDSYVDNPTDKVAHSYTIVDSVVKPSCTNVGYTVYKCSTSGCTQTKNDDIKSATGHVYSEMFSKSEDECVWKCANCDATEKNTHTGLSCDRCSWSHTTHSVNINSYVAAVNPTCVKGGNTAYYLCKEYDKGCTVHLDENAKVIESDRAKDDKAHTYVGTWTIDGNGCYRVCANGCGTRQTNKHNGLSCEYCKWVHKHTWNYSSNGSQINAVCEVEGCDQTASMSIGATSIVYNGNAITANVEYGNEFSVKTGASIGEVEYYKTDTEGTTSGGTKVNEVKEVGYYYASVKITDGTDSQKTVTAATSFKISENVAEIEQDNERQFNDSKTSAVSAVDALKKDFDTDAVKSLVESAKTSIYNTSYDKDKSLEENKSVLSAIVETLKEAIEAQRSKEDLEANKASFEAYKNDAANTANTKRLDSDSDAVIALIEAAKTNIQNKNYDSEKSLSDNLALIDAILSELDTAIYNQRTQDASDKQEAELAKNKESFNAYKQTKLEEADGKIIETDSDAVKGIVATAKNSINALSYDENKSLDENKAFVDAILTKLDTDIAVQREKDANPDEDIELIANKEAFKQYKEEAAKKADEKQSQADSDAVKKIIAEAKESIDALSYDESKTLDENKAKADEILTKLDADISSQKKAEEDAKKQAEKEAELKANKASFEEYKKTVSEIVDSNVLSTDSNAVKSLILAAKTAVTKLSYDESKSLYENKAALDAIVTKLASDIKAQREKDAQPEKDPGQKPNPDEKPAPVTPSPVPKPAAKDKTVTDTKTKATYKVTVSSATNGEVIYTASKDQNAKTVTVPDTINVDGITYKVTSVAANAFKNNKKITKVTIGNNVKEIGSNAFSGCAALTSVKLGKNVTSVAANAFSGCNKLKTVTLDGKLEKIGAGAFNKCSALAKITLTANIKTIGKNAFGGCKKLKTIIIKTAKLTKKTVGANAFKGINAKVKVKVPASKLKAYKTLLKSKGIKGKKQKITK